MQIGHNKVTTRKFITSTNVLSKLHESNSIFMKMAHTIKEVAMNDDIVDCHCSIWLYEFNGVRPLSFCLIVSTPSSIFLFVLFRSFPTILLCSQSIPWGHSVLCRANPPSPSFILFSAFSRFPLSISLFVSLTLSSCSFFLDLHIRNVSPL